MMSHMPAVTGESMFLSLLLPKLERGTAVWAGVGVRKNYFEIVKRVGWGGGADQEIELSG